MGVVITLSRQMGSGGDAVALATARRLGLRVVGRELINQAARQAGMPEVALAEIDELGLLGVRPSRQTLREYEQTTSQIIRDMAGEGNLILVGRGGQVVLAGHKGVLHVRIIAPRTLRLQRIQERCGASPEAAAAWLQASDQARASYVHRHYGRKLDDPDLYDLVLNLAQLDISAASEILCVAARPADNSGSEVFA